MKCPLMTLEYRLIDQGSSIYIQDCLKEECAWWDEEVNMCSIRSFVEQFENIALYLFEIRNKMPHEEQ